MKRSAPALLLALALSGCIDHDHELVVENAGAEAVILDVEKEFNPWSLRHDDHDRRRIPAFSAWVGAYTTQLDRIKVLVRRESDGAVLYSGVFSTEDFDDAKGHILVSVYP